MFKTPQQTYLEFASEKLRALKRWLKSAAITTYDELVNLLALEEFMRKLPYSVMLHITNKEETAQSRSVSGPFLPGESQGNLRQADRDS